MAITETVTLDMTPGGIMPIVYASQYDAGGRILAISLMDHGSPHTIPDGATVQIRGTKRDKKGFAYTGKGEGSTAYFTLERQMTACAGDVICEVRITDAGGGIIGTANFILRVEPTGLADDTDTSATEIPAIEDAARAAAARAEAAAERAEAAASGGTSGGTGADGVSPTVEITPIDGGNRITITDKNGAHTADVMDGKNGANGADGATGPAGADGKNGADGVSPTVALTAISGGTRLTITDANGQHSADIMNGVDGAAGAAGADGKPGPAGADGKNGKDGVSPSVSIAQTSTGATITITDASGAHTATILNGADGEQGPAGSPGKDGADGKNGADGEAATVTIGTVTTGESGTSATVTNSGTANAAVLDFVIPRGATGAAGASGKDGTNGKDGADGVSPTVSVAQTDTGATITITDKSGEHTATILNGKNGEPGTAGAAGKDGATGPSGADGVSPTVTLTAITGGTRLTITDANGDHSTDIMNGKDGATGPAYTLTDSDKSEIVSAVLAQMTNAESEAL